VDGRTASVVEQIRPGKEVNPALGDVQNTSLVSSFLSLIHYKQNTVIATRKWKFWVLQPIYVLLALM
jgi:hypothetical protein